MKNHKYIFIVTAIMLSLLAGWFVGSQRTGNNQQIEKKETKATNDQPEKRNEKKKKATIWTCSMHPQIRQPKPGKCPICAMTLIPLRESSTEENAKGATLQISPKNIKLAEIQVSPVGRKIVSKEIRMVGKVAFDETRMAYITARMPGRIDKLFVNYTGIAVRKGDHMAEYYSPDLLVAQRELLITAKDLRRSDNENPRDSMGLTRRKMYNSVLKKLRLWGLTKRNIQSILDSGKIADHVILYAPIGGIVIQKNALEGKYFKTGDRLFSIADLSRVWVILDAYESDLVWLRYGQLVKFTTVAYPGQVFQGIISFIDPVLDKKTRTIKVRVTADNSDGKLKPGIFVNAIVKAGISGDGKVAAPDLAGKWVGPMHPGIISDKPGKCPICGMKLVKAESLYSNLTISRKTMPLVIPASAPLITGKRAVVYIKSRYKPGTFYGKEIVLGPRAGDYYIVKSGLKEGDLVVTNGNFKIDSSLQILARPSMMSAQESVTQQQTNHPTVNAKFLKQLDMIYNSYFAVQEALADDKLKEAAAKMQYLGMMLKHVSSTDLDKRSQKIWQKLSDEIRKMVAQAEKAENINRLREIFSSLSGVIDKLSETVGTSRNISISKFKCPMAFNNKGAVWLQRTDKIANPYLGQTMPKCGEKVEDKVK